MRRGFSIVGVVMVMIAAAFTALAGPSPASVAAASAPAAASTLVNFNGSGQQVVRFDTDGNAVDAHDGMIAQFGGTYYLYGTSYDCGYRFGANSDFCGFKVYTSPDLVHWTDRGYVVKSYSCVDCFRPHVLYDRSTRKYVLWTNDLRGVPPDSYRVYTSNTPVGPFTEQSFPQLAAGCAGTSGYDGDFALFQDPVSGRAYIVHDQTCKPPEGLVVEQLTENDLTSDGQVSSVDDYAGGISPVEAPSMFYRDGRYYITMSDPTCAYCTGTGTGYVTSTSPLGPWIGTSPWSVSGGQLQVDGGGTGVAAEGSSWTDYSFAADVSPLQTGSAKGISYAQAGMVVRADSAGDGYGFLLSNYPYTSPAVGGYVVFVKFQGGSVVSTDPAPLPFAVSGGQSYHVVITATGDRFAVSVNGVAAESATGSSFPTGTVGFSENAVAGESADFRNVQVTGADGTVLLADDFSDGLTQWDPPVAARIVSSDSCGGQPSFVAPLRGPGGQNVYLYGSDLWYAHDNEALANYFWAPLHFDTQGAIQPIQCAPTVSVELADRHPGIDAPVPGLDQTSGMSGFSVGGSACDIAGNTEQMQTFTTGRDGFLTQVQLTGYQETTPVQLSGNYGGGSPVNAPLTLRLVTLSAAGGIDHVLAERIYAPAAIGWSARHLVLNPEIPVHKDQVYALVASSPTTQGCYGTAANTTDPYPGGHAATSTDGGQTFTTQPGRDLAFRTIVSGHATGAIPIPVTFSPSTLQLSPGGSTTFDLSADNSGNSRRPTQLTWQARAGSGLQLQPAGDTITVPAGQTVNMRITVTAGSGALPGYYQISLSESAGTTLAPPENDYSLTAQVAPAGQRLPAIGYTADISANTVYPLYRQVLPDSTTSLLPGNPITVGANPVGVAATPDGKSVYVSNRGSNSVSVIDTASNTVTATIPVGAAPYQVAMAANGQHAYVADNGSNSVSVIDTATNTVVATVPVGGGPFWLAITPDGQHVYVTDNSANTVTPIDTATNTAGPPIPVGTAPRQIAITPDGHTAYVTNLNSNTVTPIDTATNTAGSPISLPCTRPDGAAIDPANSTLYIDCLGTGAVLPIHTATNTIDTPIPVSVSPQGIAIGPGGDLVYITDASHSTITPIQAATGTTLPPISVPSTYGIAFLPAGSE